MEIKILVMRIALYLYILSNGIKQHIKLCKFRDTLPMELIKVFHRDLDNFFISKS